APGISPKPLDDLIFHGGKIVPQMEFQNIFLGGQASWKASDIDLIDTSITAAMQDAKLNNMVEQYFVDVAKMSADPRKFIVDDAPKPAQLAEPGVKAKVQQLVTSGKVSDSNLDTVIFNLILPPGSVLSLDDSNSLNGLGGYHGSTHFNRNGKTVTAY